MKEVLQDKLCLSGVFVGILFRIFGVLHFRRQFSKHVSDEFFTVNSSKVLIRVRIADHE
jgi:hypothetical protein